MYSAVTCIIESVECGLETFAQEALWVFLWAGEDNRPLSLGSCYKGL